MSKVILLDVSVMSFKAAFQAELAAKYKRDGGFILPSHYTYFSSIIAALKKINVEENDTVILTVDSKSWRKELSSDYKGNRKENREKHQLIDWDAHFSKCSEINQRLDYATPFHVIAVPRAEADDIISVACRTFKDKEIIIASIDSDLQQLCYYENVKFFSLNFKTPKGKGGYLKISKEEALKILNNKVMKGDVSDNIIVYPTDDENDAELRRILVNLLELPKDIEQSISEVLQNLPDKQGIKWEELPFKNSLGKRFEDIYNPSYKVSPEYCYALKEKRTKLKKKKEADKRQLKKLEKINDN
jgi:5'-3' exonuclease